MRSFATSESGAKSVTRSIRESCEAGATSESIPSSRRWREQDEHGQDRADGDERRPQPDQADDRGRDERADRGRPHRETPGDAEHPREDVVGDGALEQREARDVDDAVGRADHREQAEHRRGVGQGRHQHDRDAPRDERPGERRREPLAAQRDCSQRADEAARPDRGSQVADLRGALVQHLVGGHDDQHVEAPAHERLRGDQADEEACAGDVADRPEALPDLDAAAARGARRCGRARARGGGTRSRPGASPR